MTAFTATAEGQIVAAHLWYQVGEVAHSHLAASDPIGDRVSAMYALYASAIEHFRSRARWINLGGGAGVRHENDGLAKFKNGWTNDTRVAYFCGRVLDAARYRQLAGTDQVVADGYFPAYRRGEF